MNVLVTGGSGFIGINIVRKLLIEDNKVVCMTRRNLDESRRQFLDVGKGELIIGIADIGDFNKIKDLMKSHVISHVIHAAAITPSTEMERDNPEKVMEINLNGTVNILNAARKTGVDKFIYLSSNGVYGNIDADDEIVREDHKLNPNSLYSVAKIASEMYCRKIQELFGIQTISARIGSTYGPMEAPTFSRTNMSLIYRIIHHAVNHKRLSVMGKGSSRNWTHVYDIAGAIIALLNSERLDHDLYNISFGKNYSILRILNIIKEIMPDFRYEFTANASESTFDLTHMEKRGILGNSRLLMDSNFQPQYDLKEGIQQYITWLANSKKGK